MVVAAAEEAGIEWVWEPVVAMNTTTTPPTMVMAMATMLLTAFSCAVLSFNINIFIHFILDIQYTRVRFNYLISFSEL